MADVPPRPGDLFERRYSIDGAVIELLAEVEVEGLTLHLRDVAIFPSGVARAPVGAAAVFRTLRRTLVPEVRAYGFTSLRITATRLSGAGPGRNLDLTIDLTEEER